MKWIIPLGFSVCIVIKVFEKNQIQSNQNQEHIVDKIAQKVQTENKQCEKNSWK